MTNIIARSPTNAELEALLMDIMGQCAWLTMRIRGLVEVKNVARSEISDIEAHLLRAGRAACGIDARLSATVH